MNNKETVSLLLEFEKCSNVNINTLLELLMHDNTVSFTELISLSRRCGEIEKSYRKSLPFHVNVITAAARGRLKETAHSIILHDLLHHPAILSSFLEEIVGIDGKTFITSDIVYPDMDRIDLSLRSKDKKFLIIENKVNLAQEQKGQLCRYYSLAKESCNEKDIIILYLNKDSYDMPSIYSRSRDGVGSENDVDTVKGDKIKIRSYKHDILNWLDKLVEKSDIICETEPYLNSALLQYIDYLEEYFQTKDKYQRLHNMIDEELRKSLGIDETMSLDSQIELLEDKKSSLDRLKDGIERLIVKANREKEILRFEAALKELNDEFNRTICFKIFNLENPEMGFDVEFNHQKIRVAIIFYNGKGYYWRIYDNLRSLDDIVRNHIREILTLKMDDKIRNSAELRWDIYGDSSSVECIQHLTQLADLFSKAPDFNVCN